MSDEKTCSIEELIPGDHSDSYGPLAEMFDWQRRFGDHCFAKNDIRDKDGNILTFDTIYKAVQEMKLGSNDLPVVWLEKFLECMEKECDELRETIPWKHWSKDTLGEKAHPELDINQRLNMARIELIDIWHFLMSAMICLGIGPGELHRMYIDKNRVNFERQAAGYNVATKTEADNIELASQK